jgi:hypothetical protein
MNEEDFRRLCQNILADLRDLGINPKENIAEKVAHYMLDSGQSFSVQTMARAYHTIEWCMNNGNN